MCPLPLPHPPLLNRFTAHLLYEKLVLLLFLLLWQGEEREVSLIEIGQRAKESNDCFSMRLNLFSIIYMGMWLGQGEERLKRRAVEEENSRT